MKLRSTVGSQAPSCLHHIPLSCVKAGKKTLDIIAGEGYLKEWDISRDISFTYNTDLYIFTAVKYTILRSQKSIFLWLL